MTGIGLGRDWIGSHLPHRGAMSLLDEVVAWDSDRLHARATGHRSTAHPLRRSGLLPIACAIEYGAQAAAAHGTLLAPDATLPGAGFLASARSVRFHARRLDDVTAPLDIEVERLAQGAGGVLYEFRVAALGRALAEGRVAIMLDALRVPPPAGPA